MKYNRFARLNSKKINEYLKESNPPYEMAKLFPYLTTRSVNMDNRHTISSFKTMIKKYKYCYGLYNNCIASLKTKDSLIYDTHFQIDNKVYVFTNISPYEIDMIDCYLIYDRDAVIASISNEDNIETQGIVSKVLYDLNKRKISKSVLQNLASFCKAIDFIPNNYTDILKPMNTDKNPITKSLFEEFRWRCLVNGYGIYKNEYDSINNTLICNYKDKVEDNYSILASINRYYHINAIIANMEKQKAQLEKLLEFQKYNLQLNKKKLIADIVNSKEFEASLIFTEDRHFNIRLLFDEKLTDMKQLLKIYAFLQESHSKDYKKLFNKYRQSFSKWKTQQILRKFKNEYNQLIIKRDALNSLEENVYQYLNSLQSIKKEYDKNLGDNGIANDGFGYMGDGFYDHHWEDDPDAVQEKRMEESWLRQAEEDAHNDYKDAYLNYEYECECEHDNYMDELDGIRFYKMQELFEDLNLDIDIDIQEMFEFTEYSFEFNSHHIDTWLEADYDKCIQEIRKKYISKKEI